MKKITIEQLLYFLKTLDLIITIPLKSRKLENLGINLAPQLINKS